LEVDDVFVFGFDDLDEIVRHMARRLGA